MKNRNYRQSIPLSPMVMDGELADLRVKKRGSQALATHSASAIIQSAVLGAGQERCRALLAKSAMENAAALSALESHLREVAPLGAPRYKALADTFCITTAMRLANWR